MSVPLPFTSYQEYLDHLVKYANLTDEDIENEFKETGDAEATLLTFLERDLCKDIVGEVLKTLVDQSPRLITKNEDKDEQGSSNLI